MVNFSPLAAEIGTVVWGTPANFNGFCVGSITAQHCSSGRQPNFAALNRGRHLYSAGGITFVGHWHTFLVVLETH